MLIEIIEILIIHNGEINTKFIFCDNYGNCNNTTTRELIRSCLEIQQYMFCFLLIL